MGGGIRSSKTKIPSQNSNFKSHKKIPILLLCFVFFNTAVFSQALWQPNGSDKVFTFRKTGVGTNNPSEMLDVNGRTKVRGNAYFDSLITAFAITAEKAVFNSLSSTNAVISGQLTAEKIITDNITSSSGKIDFGNNDLTTNESITGGKIYASQLNATGHGNFGATVNYNSDLSAAYSNRSLVDKEYVDNKVAGIPPPSIPLLSSVLTAGRNADAAGTINDNAGTSAIDINNRKLSNTDGNLKIDWEQGYLYNAPANVLSLKWNSRELIGSNGATAVLNWANKKLQAGVWEYDADYSGNYTNRSLVDKQYVDTKVASVSSIFSAGTGQYAVMNNLAGGNSAQAQSSFIGSGNNNTIASNAIYGIILGGSNNQIQNAAVALPQYNLIGNGSGNTTASTSQYSFIAGGQSNRIEGKWSAVLSGISNLNQANHSFIGTGQNNNIYPNAEFGVILSGRNNTIQNAVAAGPADEDKFNFISSGNNNTIQSNAHHSSIIGGKNNIISNGVENSVILGGSNITATQSNTVYMQDLNISGAGNFANDLIITGKIQASAYASNSPLIFEAPVGTERARIDDVTGNLGIGTSTPIQTLDVNGGINVGQGVIQQGGTQIPNTKDLGLYSLDGLHMRFVTNNAPFRFFSDGQATPEGGTELFSIEPDGTLRTNEHDIKFRSGFPDGNHGIGWYGEDLINSPNITKLFASTNVNGPVVYGYDGGALGMKDRGNGIEKIVLRWDGTGKVYIATDPSQVIGASYELNVCGTIRAREIIVDETGWCDFVFDDNYKRMTFDEQKEYYATNKRLKGIASEKQIVQNGLPVSETMKGFVQNLEEARLDAIELYGMIQELKKENEMMKQKIKSLENK